MGKEVNIGTDIYDILRNYIQSYFSANNYKYSNKELFLSKMFIEQICSIKCG